MSTVQGFTAVPTAFRVSSLDASAVRGQESLVDRVLCHSLSAADVDRLRPKVRYLAVSDGFAAAVAYFRPEPGRTPAGFRVEAELVADGVLRFDLVRDIAYDADGVPRPTNLLFSADSANPYEVAPVAPLLANLTCNPGIVYDLFLNNPAANVGGAFKDRDEVIAELGRVLGSGCDISVELDNPFEQDFSKILDEAERFREMLSPWRVVIKVPHTGPVSHRNVSQLLHGDKRLDTRWWEPTTEDALRGHNLALRLREHGFRVNFTLMFEPHQTQLALQARPYFINSFVRHRLNQTAAMARLVDDYRASGDDAHLVELRELLLRSDYLSAQDHDHSLQECLELAEGLVRYRRFHSAEGADGLDGVRHNLRVLREANLPETRLIICSMEGADTYPDIDRLLAEDEFRDMNRRVVVTAEPSYLARFTSASQVVSYQRRFMNAAPIPA